MTTPSIPTGCLYSPTRVDRQTGLTCGGAPSGPAEINGPQAVIGAFHLVGFGADNELWQAAQVAGFHPDDAFRHWCEFDDGPESVRMQLSAASDRSCGALQGPPTFTMHAPDPWIDDSFGARDGRRVGSRMLDDQNPYPRVRFVARSRRPSRWRRETTGFDEACAASAR